MRKFVQIFSTREIATVIWATLILIYVMRRRDFRASLFKFIKAIFAKKLLLIWTIYIAYVSFITYLFSSLSVWKNIYLKDILIWTLTSGIIYYANALSKDADEKYIRNMIKNNLGLIVILEFIVSTFTFNIFVELMIIPIVTVLIVGIYMTENNKNQQYENKFYNVTLTTIVFSNILAAVIKGIREFRNLNKIDTIVSLITPIAYMLLSIPLVYILELYSKYEIIFIRINLGNNLSKKNYRKRKLRVFKACGLSIKKTMIFQKEILPKMYMNLTDNEFKKLLIEFSNY